MAVAQRQDKGTPVGRTEVAFAGVKTKLLRNLRVGAALPAAIEAPNNYRGLDIQNKVFGGIITI